MSLRQRTRKNSNPNTATALSLALRVGDKRTRKNSNPDTALSLALRVFDHREVVEGLKHHRLRLLGPGVALRRVLAAGAAVGASVFLRGGQGGGHDAQLHRLGPGLPDRGPPSPARVDGGGGVVDGVGAGVLQAGRAAVAGAAEVGHGGAGAAPLGGGGAASASAAATAAALVARVGRHHEGGVLVLTRLDQVADRLAASPEHILEVYRPDLLVHVHGVALGRVRHLGSASLLKGQQLRAGQGLTAASRRLGRLGRAGVLAGGQGATRPIRGNGQFPYAFSDGLPDDLHEVRFGLRRAENTQRKTGSNWTLSDRISNQPLITNQQLFVNLIVKYSLKCKHEFWTYCL